MNADEIKWTPKSKPKFPKTLLDAYGSVETKIITPENYHEFL